MNLFNQALVLENKKYSEVEEIAQSCNRCQLAQTRRRVVFGTGAVPCDLMLIGEGPGGDEDIQGLPFVGRAGQLLTKILESAGLKRPDDIYITNIVKCRPPNNRLPLPGEIEPCAVFLEYQIKTIAPCVILLAGSLASQTVLKTKEPITKIRGHWFKLTDETYCLPIFHPSYLLRNPSMKIGSPKWLLWQDLQEALTARKYFKLLKDPTP
jgi:DNA polymerase